MNQRDKKRLNDFHKRLLQYKKDFLGYPCDADFDYSELYKFLKFPLNNAGDPFEHSVYKLETKEFEQEVLEFFAKLYNCKKYWGYVTNGGTEGNMYGMYLGREALPKAEVFFSEDIHYSIVKNAHILRMKHRMVKSQAHGEMDYVDFEKKVKGKKEVIIVANIGTTMKGAVDNVKKIISILKKHKVKYYIHADAALYGMVLPFVGASSLVDFKTGIHSIAVSGHKFIGSPIPCGVVIARKNIVKDVTSYIEYIHAHDTTLSGSRDAFTPLIIWHRLKTIGLRGFQKQAKHCVKTADYLKKELEKMGWKDVASSYLTVYFKRPPKHIIEKWELAVQEDIAHVICMPHDDKKHIDAFLKDMSKCL